MQTTPVILGRDPADLQVHLIPSDPFTCYLQRDDGQPWPVGTTCQLTFATSPAITWSATVDPGQPDRFVFDIPEGQVDELIAAAINDRTRATLTFDGLVQSVGVVHWRD